MRDIVVIYNPAAGYGGKRRRIERLIPVLRRMGYRPEVRLTSASGNSVPRARHIGAGTKAVIVAGGDGTLNQVLNGLEDPTRTPLLLFPLGTSNSLARELGITNRIAQLIEVLAQDSIRRLDMGTVNGRRFLLFAGAGFDGMVIKDASRWMPVIPGYGRFVIPVFKTAIHYRQPDLRVRVDGNRAGGGMVIVGNIRNYGWIFRGTDRAQCDSGHLDVCVLARADIPGLMRYAFHSYRARLSSIQGVHYLTGKEILVESPAPIPVQVDGDYFGSTPLRIGVVASAIPMLVPASQNLRGRAGVWRGLWTRPGR